MRRLKREKRVLEQQSRALLKLPNRKERSEVGSCARYYEYVAAASLLPLCKVQPCLEAVVGCSVMQSKEVAAANSLLQ